MLIYRRICLIFESEVRSDDLTIAMVFVAERKLLAAKIQRIPLMVVDLSREGIKKKSVLNGEVEIAKKYQ